MTPERRPSSRAFLDRWKDLSPYIGLNDGPIDWSFLERNDSPEANSVEAEVAAFDVLRSNTYKQMQQDLSERLAYNATPSPIEILLGTYIEALEPQVRVATITMRDKGYETMASGFFGSDDDWRTLGIDNPMRTYDPSNRRAQYMDFRVPFGLSLETRQQLAELGAETPEYPGLEGQVLRIGFEPETPDLYAIESQWNAIADALPDLGAPAGPRMGSLEATEFGIYCPPDISWPMGELNAAMDTAFGSDPIAFSGGIGGMEGMGGAEGGEGSSGDGGAGGAGGGGE